MPCGVLKVAVSKPPSSKPGRAAADHVQHLIGVQVGDDDAVVVAVGDEQAVARRVRQHLAGESQQPGGLLRAFQRQLDRLAVDLADAVEVIDHAADQPVEGSNGISPACFASMLPRGSITKKVGQALTPYGCQTMKSLSLMTGCSSP